MSRVIIDPPCRQVCLGSMDKIIIIHSRDMKAPAFGETNFTEDLERKVKEVWASIKTAAGKVIFDGVSTDVSVTHQIFIRHDPDITSENWIELPDTRLLRIINIQNFDESDKFMELLCNIRGPKNLGASRA